MLNIGIVGLPNVGKSTLFSALTKKQVDCENFPFCTIEPNVGVVEVPDARLARLAEISKTTNLIPTAIEFVDIAGLVKGAHKGEGLGNKFLTNIRETDMILHVVRSFTDTDVHHVDGSVDAVRDVEIIELELIMADVVVVQKRIDNLGRKMKAGASADEKFEMAALEKFDAVLTDGKLARTADLLEDERRTIKGLNLLTDKEVVYVVNVSEEDAKNPNWKSPLGEERYAIPICVSIEAEIASLPEEDAKMFLEEYGLEESGLDRVIKACYKALNLLTFFTSGEKETRAWTIPVGARAPQAAGAIHTDFEKGFIRSETISYEDFLTCDGWSGARDEGKLRVEGKDYVMVDGDVCLFRFN
jgi:ribosome-binding ATPase